MFSSFNIGSSTTRLSHKGGRTKSKSITSSDASSSIFDNSGISRISSRSSLSLHEHLSSSPPQFKIIHEHKEFQPPKIPEFDDAENEFLIHIDPYPVEPPRYDTMNPSRKISFPIYETYHDTIQQPAPPSYSPAVDEITLVSMKLEWESPMAPIRYAAQRWKIVLMEVNSTQLNFYDVDALLQSQLKKTIGPRKNSTLFGMNNNRNEDITFQSYTKSDNEKICQLIRRNKSKYLHDANLVKSYSLQFGRVGFPTDLSSKNKGKRTSDPIALRLRCEAQQFLLQFTDMDSLIMSAVHIDMGISVSLDLQIRELPTYRIVPRRRRRRRRSSSRKNKGRKRTGTAASDQIRKIFTLPSDSNAKTDTGGNGFFKSKLQKFFSGNNAATLTKDISKTAQTTDLARDQEQPIRRESVISIGFSDEGEELIDTNEDEEDLPTTNDSAQSVYQEEGIYPDDDDEEEEDEDDGDEDEYYASDIDSDDDYKWSPTSKQTSRRRYVRDSLRCIKSMTENHKWVGKVVFCPTKAPSFETNNLPLFIGKGPHASTVYDTTKNHYLKAHVVGAWRLIKAGSKIYDAWNELYE